MGRNFSITEPHPSVPKTGAYFGGGRGGAGNFQRYSSSELTSGPNATGPASRTPLARATPRRTVAAGRGGAGNMFSSSTMASPVDETAVFQFDEEMLARRESHAPVYHIGRGGAANWVDETHAARNSERKHSNSSAASNHSGSSAGSNASAAARRSAERVLSIFQRRA